MNIFSLLINILIFLSISIEAKSLHLEKDNIEQEVKNSMYISLTNKEKEFIKKHQNIVLGINKDWEPSVIVNKDGTYSGIDIEVLNLINKISGANFVLEASQWHEILKKAKNKEIDGLTMSAIFKEREKYFNFSQPYISIQKLIITTKENPSNIQKIEDLEGKTIGVHESNLLDNSVASKFTKSKILKLKTYEDLIMSVVTGQTDAIIGNIAIYYKANKMDLPYLQASLGLNEIRHLVFSVRKDWPEAVSIINKALAYIGEKKLLEIKNKWYLNNTMGIHRKKTNLLLSYEEDNYLLNKKSISMCINPNIMPLDSIKNRKQIGINKNFVNIVENLIGTKMKLVVTKNIAESLEFVKSAKCDVLALAASSKDRKKYLNFTTPYLELNIGVMTHIDTPTLVDIKYLTNATIAVVKGCTYIDILKDKYPNLKIIEVNSIDDGIRKVLSKEIYGVVDTIATIGYQLQKSDNKNLKINWSFNEHIKFGFGVRDDNQVLLIILQKAVKSIKPEDKERILNQWFSIEYNKQVNFDLLWKVLLVVGVIIILVIFRQNDLKKYNKLLKEQVDKKVAEVNSKNKMLLNQHKLASMGEMLANIAHQWRQPLSTLNGIYINMENDYEEKKLDERAFNSYLNKLESITEYMSTTIKDFTTFFRPDKVKEEFDVKDILIKSKEMFESYLKDSKVQIYLDLKENIILNSYPTELMQVVFTLVYNAKDAFNINQTNRYIKISLYKQNDKVSIKVKDNAGGVKKENIDKIFDPYFTTKHNSKGTGLGLYISKIVVEKSMGGILSVQNDTDGAVFTIEI
ncbi:MAG: transporter substrate-binding domain-containing protein [Helicobacteraceae bacterium]|nr:transporter substrate-binding domain-containing protein [Helicobacteraceae bacterium]